MTKVRVKATGEIRMVIMGLTKCWDAGANEYALSEVEEIR